LRGRAGAVGGCSAASGDANQSGAAMHGTKIIDGFLNLFIIYFKNGLIIGNVFFCVITTNKKIKMI